MGAICRITICAFKFRDIPKGLRYGYTNDDLLNGIGYAAGLLEDGFTHEPHDGFSLVDYINWCREMIFVRDGEFL